MFPVDRSFTASDILKLLTRTILVLSTPLILIILGNRNTASAFYISHQLFPNPVNVIVSRNIIAGDRYIYTPAITPFVCWQNGFAAVSHN